MANFLALYRGRTVAEAELIALSAEPRIVDRFFAELVGKPEPERRTEEADRQPQRLEVVRDE